MKSKKEKPSETVYLTINEFFELMKLEFVKPKKKKKNEKHNK
jgi:hypothetical protein